MWKGGGRCSRDAGMDTQTTCSAGLANDWSGTPTGLGSRDEEESSERAVERRDRELMGKKRVMRWWADADARSKCKRRITNSHHRRPRARKHPP